MRTNLGIPGWTAGIALSLLFSTGICAAAEANPPKPDGAKTLAQREHEAHAEALKAVHDGVERVLAKHPEVPPELKASLRSPSLQESWVRSVADAAKKALETTPLLKGVNVTAEMRRDFQANALKELSESGVEEIITRSLAASKEAARSQPGAGVAGRGNPLAGVPRNLSASQTYVHREHTDKTTGQTTVEDKHDYKVNGKEVSKEEYERTKAQIDGLANDLAQLMQAQRR